MSGICGMISLRGETPNPTDIEHMLAQLHHRGPDDWQVVVDGPCALGHAAMFIHAPEEADRQPLHVEHTPYANAGPQERAWITFNGEIYNHQSIRSPLKAMRRKFASSGDAETLLQAYLQYGAPNFIKAFRGKFALAIWDVSGEKLTLMRDRLGEQPLYYARVPGAIIFASELRALLAHPAVPTKLNMQTVSMYLLLGYVPAPQTLLSGVRSLPPGSMLQVNLSDPDGTLRISPYWEPYAPTATDDERPEDDITADLLAHLRWSVRLRLDADRPVGVFLDGDLNSTALLALVSEEASGRIPTTSLEFTGAAGSGTDQSIRRISATYVSDHRAVEINDPPQQLIEEVLYRCDHPIGDPSFLTLSLLTQRIGDHIGVLLTADGADDIFAGSVPFNAVQFSEVLNRLPDQPQNVLRRLFNSLPQVSGSFQLRATRILSSSSLPIPLRYLEWVAATPPEWLAEMMDEDQVSQAVATYQQLFPAQPASNRDEMLSQLLDANLKTSLVNNTLPKLDQAGMSASVAMRAPYLDHLLMRFVADVPPGWKLQRGTPKYIFRRAMQDLIPRRIMERRTQALDPPLGDWLRGDLMLWVNDVLLGPRSNRHGLLNPEALRSLLNAHEQRNASLTHAIWTLLALEIWMQRIFDD
ncbi:MAG: asparagine synthase (glutamine-hydrolyzing) [Chloroflexi bacterium]|nr:asparagine synthase (glutamine-hydrolyzing) [Chloroflexota bacterium]